MELTLVSYEPERPGVFRLTVEQHGLFSTLLGWKPRRRVFLGSCTVWHELPHFRRPGTMVESALADMEARAKFERRRASV